MEASDIQLTVEVSGMACLMEVRIEINFPEISEAYFKIAIRLWRLWIIRLSFLRLWWLRRLRVSQTSVKINQKVWKFHFYLSLIDINGIPEYFPKES